jgi:hypothetical protein
MDGNRRIWGTAYTQAEMTAAIRRFLVTFHAEAEEGAQQQEQPAAAGLATYVGLLRQVCGCFELIAVLIVCVCQLLCSLCLNSGCDWVPAVGSWPQRLVWAAHVHACRCL